MDIHPVETVALTRSILIDWIPILEEQHINYTFDIPEQPFQVDLDSDGYMRIINANQGLKAREGGRKTAQKSRECKYVANKSHNTLLRCLRQ